MAGRIGPEAAEEILRPWLGSGFLDRAGEAVEAAAAAISEFRPLRDDVAGLQDTLDSLLFLAVRDDTGNRMALVMDDGRLIRLQVGDFSIMADELLWLVFMRMPRTQAGRDALREYGMRSGSLSALRALYLLYRDLQTPEETDTIRRVITTCHEPFRFRPWMDADTP